MESETDLDTPSGSNADEWHVFLAERLDNRATHPNGLTYAAVQIAGKIDELEAQLAERDDARKEVSDLNLELKRTYAERDEYYAELERIKQARSDLVTPFTVPEIIEIGKAILPHLSSETNTQIGAISHDVSVAVTRILRSRAQSIGETDG